MVVVWAEWEEGRRVIGREKGEVKEREAAVAVWVKMSYSHENAVRTDAGKKQEKGLKDNAPRRTPPN